MKLKKLFAMSLAFIITGTLLPISQNISDNVILTAYAEPEKMIIPNDDEPNSIFDIDPTIIDEKNNITYTTTNRELTLAKCDKYASGQIDIPDNIDGLPVRYIGRHAFFECENITSINIPNSVNTIGDGAFYQCKNLKSVSIGNNVKTIDYAAFFCCLNLKSIELRNNPTTIENHTFAWCINLKNITLPPSVTTIKRYAFSRCSSLEFLECGENVSKFYLSAIVGCENMKYLTFKNPTCEFILTDGISDDGETFTPQSLNEAVKITDKIVIKGYKNSTAETVAKKYGFKFSALPTYGDPTADGKINSVDASEILSIYAKNAQNKSKPSSDDLECCDINKDGAVNAVDASYVLAYYAYTATNKNRVSLTDYMKKK
jgi:hypothetical protein